MAAVSSPAIFTCAKRRLPRSDARALMVFHANRLEKILSFSDTQTQRSVMEVSGTIFRNVVALSHLQLIEYLEEVHRKVNREWGICYQYRQFKNDLLKINQNREWNVEVMSQMQDKIVMELSSLPIRKLVKILKRPPPSACVHIAIIRKRAQKMMAQYPKLNTQKNSSASDEYRAYCRQGFQHFKQRQQRSLAYFCARYLFYISERVIAFTEIGEFEAARKEGSALFELRHCPSTEKDTEYLCSFAKELIAKEEYEKALVIAKIIPLYSNKARLLIMYARSLYNTTNKERAHKIMDSFRNDLAKKNYFFQVYKEKSAGSNLKRIEDCEIKFIWVAFRCFDLGLKNEREASIYLRRIEHPEMRDVFSSYLSTCTTRTQTNLY